MNKKVLLATVALSSLMVARAACAMELWDPATTGMSVGIPAGMLPPQGVYFVDDNFYGTTDSYDNSGNKVPNTKLYAYINVPVLIWSPGVKVLGATYAVAIAQPFDFTSSAAAPDSDGLNPGRNGGGNLGLYNTVINPIMLSWNLMPLFVSTSLSVYLPTATNTKLEMFQGKFHNGGFPSGNSFWTIQPNLGLTYLFPDGFSASVNMQLAFPITATNGSIEGMSYHYKSGVMLMNDYTISKAINQKWSAGIGGWTWNQLSHDSTSGTFPGATSSGLNASYGVTEFVGYQFQGGLKLQGLLSEGLAAKNDQGGGYSFNVRFSLPL